MSPRHGRSPSVIDSMICGSDFIKMKGYQWSNLGRWLRHGQLRQGRWVGSAAGGGAPWLWRWLIKDERSSHYGALFLWDLPLRMHCGERNSPWGSSSGGGNRSTACDGGRLAPTYGVVDDELQRSASNEIRQSGGGVMRRRMTWCWFGVVRPRMERWQARAVARVSLFVDQYST
jgi:hypothetical protein